MGEFICSGRTFFPSAAETLKLCPFFARCIPGVEENNSELMV